MFVLGSWVVLTLLNRSKSNIYFFFVFDGVILCAVLFPTRCLGWDLGLN